MCPIVLQCFWRLLGSNLVPCWPMLVPIWHMLAYFCHKLAKVCVCCSMLALCWLYVGSCWPMLVPCWPMLVPCWLMLALCWLMLAPCWPMLVPCCLMLALCWLKLAPRATNKWNGNPSPGPALGSWAFISPLRKLLPPVNPCGELYEIHLQVFKAKHFPEYIYIYTCIHMYIYIWAQYEPNMNPTWAQHEPK